MSMLSRQPDVLLLQVSALVVLGTVAAWLAGGVLGKNSQVPAVLAASTDAITVDGAEPEGEDANVAKSTERLLDNATLAMAAEQYFSPPERNARSYYESVLELDPEHAQANLGLDRLAEIVLERATAALAQEQVQTAINQLAAAKSLRPTHRLVSLVEQQLQSERSRLIAMAQVLSRSENFDLAADMLSRAEAIPAPSPAADPLQEAWDELGRLRASTATAAAQDARTATANEAARLQAEAARVQAQAQSERQRALDARIDQLLLSARAAIEEDRLLTPEWENAKQLIAELAYLEADPVAMARLRGAFLNKLVGSAAQRISDGDFDAAEGWITEAALVNETDQRLSTLREQLRSAQLAAESQRIATLNEFEFANYVAPRYPTVARQRGAEGWVEVEFLVREDGSVTDIVVLDSARTANFRDAALSAIRQWRLEPQTYLGRPISQRVRTRLAFRLGE